MQEREFTFLQKCQGLFKRRFRFAREPCHEIGRNRELPCLCPDLTQLIIIIRTAVWAPHTLQNDVRTGLQRNVQMARDPFFLRKQLDKRIIQFRDLNRRDPQPLQSIYFFQQPFYEICKCDPVFSSITSGVDPRQDNLLMRHGDLFCLVNDHIGFHGAFLSPCIRDNAIGTELVAAILNFQKSSGSSAEMIDRKRFKPDIREIRNINNALLFTDCCLNVFRKKRLMPGSDQYIRILKRIRIDLRIAADNRNNPFRMFSSGPMDHLAAFGCRSIGYRTGKDHRNLSRFLPVHPFKPCFFKLTGNSFTFICIDFAAKVYNRKSHPDISPITEQA